ncbi:MAG: 23S rRNA methyltransferase [Betaproteobacteria bacterium SG8_41]|nr:MAG: 23S rRNA methyltransferase [Betaproteobacteria bacterium SG8_41]
MGRVRGKNWMQEHVADAYVKRARNEGMRSRSAYKLEQITERDRLLRPGMTVVDLGAAPGGWSQIAARRVGPSGRVVALDVLDMESLPGVTFVSGDFREKAAVEALERALDGRPVDLVISDMAPNLSGIASVDQARLFELAELALDFALKHLKPQGNFLVKLFHGSGFDDFARRMRRHFREVLARKPEASRSRSSEVYLLGRGRKP